MSRIIRMLAFIGLVALSAAPAGAAALQYRQLPEIALREASDGLTIYVVDPQRAMVLAGRVEPGAKLSVRDLQPLSPPGMLRRPATIAVRGSRLVVVDAGTPAAFECDLVKQEWRQVWRGEPLRVPASVAIAADGSIVIADIELRGLFVISPNGEKHLTKAGEVPRRVRADDRGVLYVLDEQAGMLRVDSSTFSAAQRSADFPRMTVPVPVTPAVSDFAVIRDVFYTAEQGAVRVAAIGSSAALPMPAFSSLRVSDIAASDNFLAVLDQDRMAIAVAERALPAESVLDHLEQNPNAAWLALLDYLARRTLIASRPVRLQQDDATYEHVLARTGVLAQWDGAAKLAPPPDKVRALFCTLNGPACGPGASGFPGGAGEVVVPQVTLRPTLETDSVVLNGRNAQQLVNERVLMKEQRAAITDAYLASINPDAGNTLEAELARLGFLAATPMSGDLRAGTLVQIDGRTERAIGSLKEICAIDLPTPSRTALAQRLDAPALALPAGFRPRSGERVQITVTGWQREALPLDALARCRPTGDTADVYVITEAVSALEVHVAATGPVRKDQRAAGATITGPIYLGYKPVALSSLALGVTLAVSDPQSLKPQFRTTSSIARRTEGAITLPVTRWRADLLLPVPEYYSSSSALAELRRQNVGLELSARERLRATAMSLVREPAAGDWPPDMKRFLTESREQLRTAINYAADLVQTSGTEGVYIGVVEDSRTVFLDHPDFSNADQSAWYEYSSDVALHQHERRLQPDASAPALKPLVASLEHGTHVAGIIGARSSGLIPGLLPETNLVLVPSDNMATLVRSIEAARSERVFIFNMSLSFPAEEVNPIAAMRKRLVNSWQDSLFVVAAGNGNVDLNETGAGEPVRWAGELPNVIAVAAATTDGTAALEDHKDPDAPTKSVPGSNFGSKYVDLLAPGQMVCSLGRAGYAYACGSSQAAPQVTATAAMLWTLVRSPARLRARLIYTADWQSQFAGKAWGGLLNVQRALAFPLQNILTTRSENEPHEVVLDGNARAEIDGTEYRRDGSKPVFHAPVPFSNILRMKCETSGTCRIVLLKNGADLTIVEGDVQGQLRCRSMTHLDPATQRFGARPHPMSDCRPGIDARQIADYVAATPTDVRFF